MHPDSFLSLCVCVWGASNSKTLPHPKCNDGPCGDFGPVRNVLKPISEHMWSDLLGDVWTKRISRPSSWSTSPRSNSYGKDLHGKVFISNAYARCIFKKCHHVISCHHFTIISSVDQCKISTGHVIRWDTTGGHVDPLRIKENATSAMRRWLRKIHLKIPTKASCAGCGLAEVVLWMWPSGDACHSFGACWKGRAKVGWLCIELFMGCARWTYWSHP